MLGLLPHDTLRRNQVRNHNRKRGLENDESAFLKYFEDNPGRWESLTGKRTTPNSNGPIPIRRNEEITEPDSVHTLSDIQKLLGKVTWLWPNWIPQGMISLLIAPPGGLKSAMALAIAGIMLKQDQWPDGSPNQLPKDASVLWVDTEGFWQGTAQRAVDWGIPLDRIIVPGESSDESTLLDSLQIDTEVGLERLGQLVHSSQPHLVIIGLLARIARRRRKLFDSWPDDEAFGELGAGHENLHPGCAPYKKSSQRCCYRSECGSREQRDCCDESGCDRH